MFSSPADMSVCVHAVPSRLQRKRPIVERWSVLMATTSSFPFVVSMTADGAAAVVGLSRGDVDDIRAARVRIEVAAHEHLGVHLVNGGRRIPGVYIELAGVRRTRWRLAFFTPVGEKPSRLRRRRASEKTGRVSARSTSGRIAPSTGGTDERAMETTTLPRQHGTCSRWYERLPIESKTIALCVPEHRQPRRFAEPGRAKTWAATSHPAAIGGILSNVGTSGSIRSQAGPTEAQSTIRGR
jgi:hypothetical protein